MDQPDDGPAEIVVPVVEERLRVIRRWRDGVRVRVQVLTQSRTEAITLEHAAERVTLTRVPVGRYVEAAPQARSENGVTILPVVEEHQEVVTRLFLREEVRIETTRTTRRERQDIVLRSQLVAVSRTPPTESQSTEQPDAPDPE